MSFNLDGCPALLAVNQIGKVTHLTCGFSRRRSGSAETGSSYLLDREKIMPFEVKTCSIEDMHRHPVLRDRSVARVNVTLRENRAPETFDHDLMLKVWAYTDNDMTPADVKTALLTKAAAILKRSASLAEIQMDGDGKFSRVTISR